jgi:uncharacterized protein (DUF433 family)
MLHKQRLVIPMAQNERITRDPNVCGGEAVFKGTRVTLRTVLASLAAGDTQEQILADFPTLKPADLQAAISFAAASAEEDLPLPGTPQIASHSQ